MYNLCGKRGVHVGTCGALVGNVFIGCMWGTWGVGEHVGDWGANRDPVAAIHSPT